MPIYTYQCKRCGTTFDFLKVKRSEKPSCPKCKSTDLKKQMTAAGVIMSDAARPAGQTCCGREERCTTPPCSDTGTCRRD